MELLDLYTRTMGGFPLSVGTSLAFESLFKPRQTPYDPERKIPQELRIEDYQEVWINVATLIRNIASAANMQSFLMTHEDVVLNVLNLELETIESIFANEGRNVCKVHFYYATYTSLGKSGSRFITLRSDSTDAQKEYSLRQQSLVKSLSQYKNKIKIIDKTIEPNTINPKGLIITHIPYDLLSHSNFGKLSLLETYTGVLKQRNEWNTKYNKINNVSLANIPFTRKLLLVFGDSILIQPMDIKFRKMIVDIANNRKWTSLTTDEKVRLDLNLDLKDRYLFDVYNSI